MNERERFVEHVLDKMVERFLAWPLPETVCSDGVVMIPGKPHRTGTNLLTADEARAMFKYALRGDDFEGFIKAMRGAVCAESGEERL